MFKKLASMKHHDSENATDKDEKFNPGDTQTILLPKN